MASAEPTVETLVDFVRGPIYPQASLTLGSDGNFYGTTNRGGAADKGAVFRVTPAGVLSTLVEFSGNDGATLGESPQAALLQGSDGNFYGTTQYGGEFGNGTVFRLTPAGALTTLVSFSSSEGNLGDEPSAALVQSSDGNFYGTTAYGGASDKGTVFRMTPAGALTTLVEFTGTAGAKRGTSPRAALVRGSDGNFYGTTTQGGASDKGTVFRMTPAGALTTLVEFTGTAGANRGATSAAALTPGSDGNFYGATTEGGASDKGTVFRMTPAGALTTLVEFTGIAGANRGSNPRAALVRGSDGNFYGTTYDGPGTVFRITPAGVLTTLADIGGSASNRGFDSWATLVLGNDGNFYGTTEFGGAANVGTVFCVTPAGVLTTIADLAEDATTLQGGGRGGAPHGLTKGPDGNFYGTTYYGGASNQGTVFRLTPAGALSTLVEFTGYSGASPFAALTLGSDGNFYGTTQLGGPSGAGTVFRVTPAGMLSPLVGFTNAEGPARGYFPRAALVQGNDGNFYGTTYYGGASNQGTVFRLTPAGALTTLVDFTGTVGANRGASPQAALVQGSDGNFYGTTYYGGVSDKGTIFRMTPAGVLTTLVEFTSVDGVIPRAFPSTALTKGDGGTFYGTTASG